MAAEIVGEISRRVVSALEEYAQSKDPRVLDNVLFLSERMYRLVLAVEEEHGAAEREAAELIAAAITILQVSSVA